MEGGKGREELLRVEEGSLLNVRVVTLRVAIMSQYFYFATVVVEHTRNGKQ